MYKVLIEGCRAVGKTTLCNHLISLGVVSFYRERFELNEDFSTPETQEEFEFQQKWYISREINFWHLIDEQKEGLAVVIASPETLDFYTRNYTKAYKKKWGLTNDILDMLKSLSQLRSDLIIYLTAENDAIIHRMQKDTKRRPLFWDYFNRWQELNQNYYKRYTNVVWIDTTNKSAEEVCSLVMQKLRERGAI